MWDKVWAFAGMSAPAGAGTGGDGSSPPAGAAAPAAVADAGAAAAGLPPPGSPARNTRASRSSTAGATATTASSSAAATVVASASSAASSAGSSTTAGTSKGGSSKGSLHPNELIFKKALEESHQLVQEVGWKLVDAAATEEELLNGLQRAGARRKLLQTLDAAGIPNPRKQRYVNDAAAQNIALQTLEDLLRLQVQNLRNRNARSLTTTPSVSQSAVVTTAAALVAASSAAATTGAPTPYAAATAAALAAASAAPTLSGAQGRLLNLALGNAGTAADPAATAAAALGGGTTDPPRLTPTSVVGPAFMPSPTTVVSSLPAPVPSLAAAPNFGGSSPSLPQAIPGMPPPALGAAVGPLAAAPASAPASISGLAELPWIPVPGELGVGNQFSTTCSQGPAYYMSFPPPWNLLPPAEDSHLNTMFKIAPQALPKFSGDRRGYLTWRNTFIPCVHLTNIDVRFKAMLLRSSLVPNSARMREFIDSIPGTGPGYRYAITELENRYGGQEAVLMAKQDALLALPMVKEGDYRTIETMQSRLGTFLIEWTNLAGAPITESESLAFYTMLMGKVDSLYTLKYLAWLQQFGLRKGVQSLYQWLANELKHHRTAETFAHQRLKTTTPFPKPGGGGIGPQLRSQAQQYHHLGWEEGGEAALTGGDEGAEGALESYLGEEGDEHAFLLRQHKSAGKVPRRPPCPLCGEDHGLGRCAKFMEMQPTERKGLLAKERRCFLCFQRGHNVGRCHCTYTCSRCKQKHHTLLHGADEGKETTLYTREEEEADYEAATETLDYGLKAVVGGKCKVSLRTLPILLVNPTNGKRMMVNALLDDGCTTAALVSEHVSTELGLVGPTTWTATEGVGGKVTKYQTILTVVEVCGLSSSFRRKIPAQVMGKPAGSYQAVNWRPLLSQFPHLKDINVLPPVGEGEIDVLLGSKCAELLSSQAEVVGTEDSPVARKTALGWTITGPTRPQQTVPTLPRSASAAIPLESALFASSAMQEGTSVTLVALPQKKGIRLLPSDKQLAHLVQRMLEVEDPGEAEVLSPKEEYIIKTLRTSLQMVEGKYQVSCTWSPGTGRPPLNLGLAQGRLKNLEKGKVFREPRIRAAYGEVFRDWEKKDIVRRVQLDTQQVLHLLPHFPILKESESTPVRPVMGCDVALNKFLLPGPNLLNEVVGVLLRFRSGRYTIAGDIKQMFLNIRLTPADRPYHCFLWNDDATSSKPTVYQFQRHVFGNAGSPCVAVFVLKEHARKFRDTAPAAVDTLLHSTLIDDVLDSVETEEEAEELLSQVRHIVAQAGMTLAKIHTNSTSLRKKVEPGCLAVGALDLSAAGLAPALQGLKTLGLAYRQKEDEFYFSMPPPAPQQWTKRGVLKLFPRLFDPLGLLLPFSIRARVYFSSLARNRYSWDEKLPPAKEWQDWLADLELLPFYSIPRNVRATCPGSAVLHVFADASQEAYAAVAYLVVSSRAGVHTNLVFAKAHVAPSKQLTIPRMELLAALLSVKVRKTALAHLKTTVQEVVHWSDSLTVLFWLNDDSQRFQAFVFNKLHKIRAATSPSEWHWVPSENNPADWATRGKDPRFLQQEKLWKEGPAFISQGKAAWPKSPALIRTSEVLKEMKKVEQVFVTQAVQETFPLPFRRYSSWNRALSLPLKLLRWRDRARSNLRLPPLEPAGVRAERVLLRVAQTEMRSAATTTSKSTQWRRDFGLTQLEPFMDKDGLLRGRGRLSQAAALPRDAREPIILPPGHWATKLIIRHTHEQVLHHAGGVSYTLNRLVARFWLPRGRQAVFAEVSKCVACKQRIRRPISQSVGDLPALRFPQQQGDERPFAVTAVDCAGPFKVKRGRSYENHYLLLLTCCHIRAVRLEQLSDLSTDSFLLALTRAGSHGVDPHTILSDNGGNFDGANRLLRALWASMPQQELERRRPTIRWRFNPPYASHYGGVFERLIGAAKAALYHALPAHLTLSLEQLRTAFAVVEGILNARPLAYISSHSADIQPLTPNHFLGGGGSRCWISFAENTAGSSLAKRWTAVHKITAAFWHRFYKEIVPFMLHSTFRRSAKTAAKTTLQVGDVVMFLLPAGDKNWPLGRIVRLFPGPDGRVRTVDVQVSAAQGGAVFRRDVRHLSLLLPAEQTYAPLI